ncbi:SgcJ/EcaC family oxidoreductase [Micromonospora sediminicola]|uniref:SgcJ/EcaC family oxidoreductase n=1 Tax=Micromonospora sediminicola TaxID=946078 RepID=UPI0033FE1658
MTTKTSTAFSPSTEDQKAVAGLPQQIMKAWAEHSPSDFADVFAEDGSMILPGVFVLGRENIRGFMEQAFAGPYKGTRVIGTPFNVRFLAADMVLLLTEGGVLEPNQTELGQGRAVRASWLAVKRDGQWKLAAYQNSPRDPA